MLELRFKATQTIILQFSKDEKPPKTAILQPIWYVQSGCVQTDYKQATPETNAWLNTRCHMPQAMPLVHPNISLKHMKQSLWKRGRQQGRDISNWLPAS